MIICLDASIVGMLISPDEKSPQILIRYEKEREQGALFIAPSLLTFEISSVLRKKQLKKLLSKEEVLTAIQFFHGLKIQFKDFDGLMERIQALCDIFGTYLTPYDASYLAVAEKYHARLLTADKRFYQTVSNAMDYVELA